jgi:phosphonate transport system substrate-binding protein
MKTLILFCCCCFLLPLRAETLSFGIVPQQSAKKLAELWTPFLRHLSEKTGEDIQFKTAKNIPTFEKRLSEGEYDIAYMNPYHFVVFHQSNGYQALVRQKNKRIKGIIVARKDATVSELSQLEGETLAFPAPAAFAASIIPRGEMRNMKINFTPRYVSSHDSVYLNVAKGFLKAGGGVMRTFNNTDPAVRDQLKIVWTSKPFTPHAVATHPDMSSPLRAKISQALLQMNDDPQAQSLLKAINFKGFEVAHNEDWKDVEDLNIESLVKPNY